MRQARIDYTVRESHRAKRVILKVSMRNGLEVVIPRRFNKRRLPAIIEANRMWILGELRKAKESPGPALPDLIELNAVGERWQVHYEPVSDDRLKLKETGPNRLLIEGDNSDVGSVSSILNRWLHLKTFDQLVPRLWGVSREYDIPFKKAMVRGQTTRWASCSKLQNITLNRCLLFLPDRLVRHVFLHELCHIRQMNHSPDFWKLLGQLEPGSTALEAELKKANQYLPSWVMQS